MNNTLKIKLVISLILLSLLLGACVQADASPAAAPPLASQGFLDLQSWDFEADGGLPLSGEWAFYWLELLSPDQLETGGEPTFVPVPTHWTRYDIDLPVEGYATYTLTVQFPEAAQTYGLYIDGEGSAYELWINGELMAANGKVGTTKESMTPKKTPQVVFFSPETETTEFVMQISNFNHRRAGFRNEIYLGLAEPVHEGQLQNWYTEAFSAGILFIMGLYHIVIYIFRAKNKAPLYFALLCFELALRVGVTNQNTLIATFPSLSWTTTFHIEYMTFLWGPPLLFLFFTSLYPEDADRWFLWLVNIVAAGFTVFLLLNDTLTASYLVNYYQAVIMAEMVYALVFMARIIIKKRNGAVFIGFASLVLFIATVVEIMIIQGVIGDIYVPNFLPVGQVSSYSFMAFVLVQAVLLSSRFSKSFERVEALSGELETVNEELKTSEKKYRSIFEDSTDVIFISTLGGKILDVSPSVTKMLGYSAEEAKQRQVTEVMAHPTDLSIYRAAFEEGESRNFEMELLRKDGSLIDVLVNLSARLNEQGEIEEIQGSVRDITDRKKAEQERLRALKFEQIAITDPLTEIYNRRFFFENAEKEIERAKRNSSPLSVILFDIDNFKRVNDTYGHLNGDQTLLNIAEICKNNIRDMDLFARYGGEEFILMMPETDINAACHVAERLRKRVAERPMVKIDDLEINVTLSMGVAEWRASDPVSVDILLMQVDKALYKAKDGGKNRVVRWDDLEQE